jgi:rhodanese-related sulfurtransferase
MNLMGKTLKKQEKSKSRSGLPVIAAGIVVLVVAVVVIWALTRDKNQSAALPPDVSVVEAHKQREAGAFMLDVREPSEWAEFHMPGATLIPLGELETRLAEVPKDKPIVVVCRSGNRSATGRDILLNNGFSQVTSMAGGMKAWAAVGYPTETGQ